MTDSQRSDGRADDALRPVDFMLDFIEYPLGSVLISMGKTRVLCNASVEEGVPRWLKGQGLGWVTGEYSMLPAATHTRGRREIGNRSGRSTEIQRLVGRSLRAGVDRAKLGEHTIVVDCDVIQADGGTRTAAITGGWVALALACARLLESGKLETLPLTRTIAAISAGVVAGRPVLDLHYDDDVNADVDLNLVMTGSLDIVEIQGTGEGDVLSRAHLDDLVELGTKGCRELTRLQARALSDHDVLASLFEG